MNNKESHIMNHNIEYITKINNKFMGTCDKIEDCELSNLIGYYTNLCEFISCLGVEFGLMKKELKVILECLEGFQRNRKIQ